MLVNHCTRARVQKKTVRIPPQPLETPLEVTHFDPHLNPATKCDVI